MAPTDAAPNGAAEAEPKEPTERQKDTAALIALGEAQCPRGEVIVIMGWEDRKDPFRHPWVQKAYNKGRAQGLRALRVAQFEMAKKSVPMATMLGRLYLGQSEQREQDENAPIDYAAIAKRIRENVSLLALPGGTQTD